jgi:hypothetical protein
MNERPVEFHIFSNFVTIWNSATWLSTLLRITRVARWFIFKPKIPFGQIWGITMEVWSTSQPSGIFYGHLVYFWYFSIFSHFGMLFQDKSGNPAPNPGAQTNSLQPSTARCRPTRPPTAARLSCSTPAPTSEESAPGPRAMNPYLAQVGTFPSSQSLIIWGEFLKVSSHLRGELAPTQWWCPA